MESYDVFIRPSAARELERVPAADRRRLVARIQALSADPRPPGVEKLSGQALYRVRQGNFRAVYEIVDRERYVTVFRVAHRRDVYR